MQFFCRFYKSRAQELSNYVSFVLFEHQTWDLGGGGSNWPPLVFKYPSRDRVNAKYKTDCRLNVNNKISINIWTILITNQLVASAQLINIELRSKLLCRKFWDKELVHIFCSPADWIISLVDIKNACLINKKFCVAMV